MDSCTGAKQLHKMKCFSFWSNNKFSESFCPSVWSTLTSRKWTTHTINKAESHWMGEGECEHRVILGKLGLTPFRGKQQSDRRQSHRQTMNRDRTSDCGRDVVTSADLCHTHMNVSISDLKSDSVRFIKPLVSWRGDPAAGLQWSKTLKHWGGPQNYLTGTQHGPVLLKKKQCRLLSQNGTQRGYSYHNQFKLLLLSVK